MRVCVRACVCVCARPIDLPCTDTRFRSGAFYVQAGEGSKLVSLLRAVRACVEGVLAPAMQSWTDTAPHPLDSTFTIPVGYGRG